MLRRRCCAVYEAADADVVIWISKDPFVFHFDPHTAQHYVEELTDPRVNKTVSLWLLCRRQPTLNSHNYCDNGVKFHWRVNYPFNLRQTILDMSFICYTTHQRL